MADLSIPEAAAALGVHIETVRRRIRRGELLARRNGRGRYVVSLPDDDTTPAYAAPTQQDDTAQQERTQDTTGVVAELRARVEGLEADKRSLLEALERSQQGEAELRRLLAAEQQRLLPPPVEATATEPLQFPTPPAFVPPAAEPVITPRRRSLWWRIWRG